MNKQFAEESAIVWGRTDIVRLLLEHGANPNSRSDSLIHCEYSTALYEASCGKELEIMRLLIQYGADVNARGFNGDTALYHLCCSINQHRHDKARLLLENGADTNTQDPNNG